MPPPNPNEEHKHWHLDKRVPVGIIIALLVQTVCFVAFGAHYIGKDQEWKTNIVARLDAIPAKIPPDMVTDRLTAVEKSIEVIKTNQMHTMSTLRAVADKLNVVPPPPNIGPR